MIPKEPKKKSLNISSSWMGINCEEETPGTSVNGELCDDPATARVACAAGVPRRVVGFRGFRGSRTGTPGPPAGGDLRRDQGATGGSGRTNSLGLQCGFCRFGPGGV